MNQKREFTEFLRSGSFNQPFALRDFSGFSGATGGAGLIATETLPLVEVLKKKLALKGIQIMSGLTGNVSVPIQTGRIAVAGVGMTDEAEAGKPVFENKTLSPVKFTGSVTIGHDLLTMCNDDIAAFVTNSLLAEISYKIQDHILTKVAEGAKETVTFSEISAIDWTDILEMEAKLSAFDLTNVAFIMSPGCRSSLKGIEKAQGTAQFLCDGENKINGYDCLVSGAVSSDTIYLGDWSKVLMGEWSTNGMNVIVDPYTKSTSGSVVITANVAVDGLLLNSEAMVIGKVQA